MKDNTSPAHRTFIKAISVIGVGAVALGGLTSCSNETEKKEPSTTKAGEVTTIPTVDPGNADRVYYEDQDGHLIVNDGNGPEIVD